MRRGWAVLAASVIGFVASQFFSVLYLVAVAICVIAAIVLLRAYLAAPHIAALRAATLGTILSAVVSVIVGTLLFFGPELPPETRMFLRGVSLACVTTTALYWLVLYRTGGFDRT